MADIVLVLNAGYEFLNVASIKRALKLVFKGKAEVVQTHPSLEVRSPGMSIKVPSVIRMLYYIVKPFLGVPFTKKNVLIRDKRTCQYCGKPGNTIDHIVPKSRGGRESWKNCVCACSRCNTRKNNRTPKEAKMKLLRIPRKPRFTHWVIIKSGEYAENWKNYLY